MRLERIALEDEGVKAEVAKLKLPEGSVVVVDPWIYGKLATAPLTVLTKGN
jgi:primary-amine oxidase